MVSKKKTNLYFVNEIENIKTTNRFLILTHDIYKT
jgi:hypothetical protein